MSGNSTDVFLQGQGATARGDFEIQFLFSIANGSLDRTHTLLSADPSNHQTDVEGFYSILLVASSSSGGSSVVFEYYDDTTDKLETVEWTIPGSLVTESTGRHHLAISFFEDDRGVDTANINPSVGKFRCYLDGVVLEDKNAAGALSVSGQFEKLGKASSSPYTLHPLYLGQYLNGLAASGGAQNLYRLDGNMNDAVGSGGGALVGTPYDTGSQWISGITGGHGSHLRTSNSTSWGSAPTNYATIPDPEFGTGAFCIEFWHCPSATPLAWGGIIGTENSGSDQFRIQADYISGSNYVLAISVGTSATISSSYNYKSSALNVLKHYALTRTADSGGNQTWSLYVDGTRVCTDSRATINSDTNGNNFRIGASHQNTHTGLIFDGLKITKGTTVYSGASLTVPPALPWEVPLDPSARFFEGKMHEFAVWNHRCLHNTSDKFAPPTTPTRSTPLSIASVVDSENTSSPILTTSNLGMLLPKAVEGLADGTAWNDKGVVKIAPLTGDLDSVPDPVVDNVLSLSARTAPAATAGVAKIYSKTIPGGDTSNILLHLDGSYNDEGSANATLTTPGSSNTVQFDVSEKKFGSHSLYFNAVATGDDDSVLIPYSHDLKFDSDYTVEFWVKFNADAHTQYENFVLGGVEASSELWTGLRFTYFGSDWVGNNSYKGWWMVWSIDSAGTAEVKAAAPANFNTTKAAYKNDWNHVAICRDTTDSRVYINGEKLDMGAAWPNAWDTGFIAGTGTINAAEEDLLLGRHQHYADTVDTVTGDAMNGWIDEFRIVKGTALYTSDFSTRTAPYSVSATAKLFCMDSLGNETQLTP